MKQVTVIDSLTKDILLDLLSKKRPVTVLLSGKDKLKYFLDYLTENNMVNWIDYISSNESKFTGQFCTFLGVKVFSTQLIEKELDKCKEGIFVFYEDYAIEDCISCINDLI